jgi:hypothetical protein
MKGISKFEISDFRFGIEWLNTSVGIVIGFRPMPSIANPDYDPESAYPFIAFKSDDWDLSGFHSVKNC